LNAKPATGLPSRTTSVMTATTDVVISEKSKPELRRSDFSGIAVSRISTMRMLCSHISAVIPAERSECRNP